MQRPPTSSTEGESEESSGEVEDSVDEEGSDDFEEVDSSTPSIQHVPDVMPFVEEAIVDTESDVDTESEDNLNNDAVHATEERNEYMESSDTDVIIEGRCIIPTPYLRPLPVVPQNVSNNDVIEESDQKRIRIADSSSELDLDSEVDNDVDKGDWERPVPQDLGLLRGYLVSITSGDGIGIKPSPLMLPQETPVDNPASQFHSSSSSIHLSTSSP